MPVLENKELYVELSEDGRLLALRNKETGRQYAGGGALWRLYFQRGDQMDREVCGCGCAPEILSTEDGLELNYPRVNYQGEQLDISVRIRIRLEGDESRWNITLNNNEDVILRECQFPLVHNLQLAPGQPLLWSDRGGEMFGDLRQAIRNTFNYYSAYMASDHLFLHKDTAYPGTATTNSFVFPAADEGLYCACYDETFGQTQHIFRLYGEALECGFARYPSLDKGQSCQLPEFVLSAYKGSWHVAARKYRRWADHWFKHQTPPEWVRRMKGWQRIILKHQYGEVHYDYKGLSQIHSDGLQAGIDALHLFGWWKGGMDNSNPDYIADDALGGREVLKSEITKFQKNGTVILYCNGRLIDLATDYYRQTGGRISIKDKFGAEIRDAYCFRGRGTYTGHFGNRTFTAACPHCQEWLEKMKEVVDIAFDLGCKGVFFDQLGMNEFPCFDASHGHEVPFMHISASKAELVRKLRDYTRRKDPQMGIGVECITDVSSANCDFIHSWPGYAVATNDWAKKGVKPALRYFIDWFRFCFPEIIMTDREIRDDTDVERRVNHALLKGLRSDVEIYRCRKTIVETPNYCAYLKKADDLRDRHCGLLLEGRYVDTTTFACSNPELEARAFTAGERMAVVVTQSHLASASGTITAAGWQYEGIDGWGWSRVSGGGEAASMQLDRHGLAVILFRKQVVTGEHKEGAV